MPLLTAPRETRSISSLESKSAFFSQRKLSPGMDQVQRKLHVSVIHLDSNIWMSHQVMIPGRMGWRTNIGSDHHQVVAIAYVHHWCRATLATLGARGREQE